MSLSLFCLLVRLGYSITYISKGKIIYKILITVFHKMILSRDTHSKNFSPFLNYAIVIKSNWEKNGNEKTLWITFFKICPLYYNTFYISYVSTLVFIPITSSISPPFDLLPLNFPSYRAHCFPWILLQHVSLYTCQ